MRLDVQGAATVRRIVPGAVTIFVAPPSLDALLVRLRRRAGDRLEQQTSELQARVATAMAELRRLREFDYVVVNREGQLEEAVADIVAIMRAEKLRPDRTEIAF
jgi:guanylate kinase